MQIRWRQSQFRLIDAAGDDGSIGREAPLGEILRDVDAGQRMSVLIAAGDGYTFIGGQSGLPHYFKFLRVAISPRLNGDQRRSVTIDVYDGNSQSRFLAKLVADANSDEPAAVEIVNSADANDPGEDGAPTTAGQLITGLAVNCDSGTDCRVDITIAGDEEDA